jgi:hypothetical protein
MEKPRVVVINPDDSLGKFMTGEAFVATYFPELLRDEQPTTGPVKQPDPVEPAPTPSVAGLGRTYLGTQTTTGNPVYLVRFPDALRVVEDHSGGKLEKFSVCGFEIAINLAPGVSRPSGPSTQGWGFNTPADFVCPADYTLGYFPGKNGRKFFAWKHYTDPAPTPVEPTQPEPAPTEPVTTDVTPAPTEAGAITETGTATYQGKQVNYISIHNNG